jgi:hypothetical protein
MSRWPRKRTTTPGWRRLPKPEFSASVVAKWRHAARERAKRKGAKDACGLCKRAIMGRATVQVTCPWDLRTNANTYRRRLCFDCRNDLVAWLNQQEYERDNYDLPIDVTAHGITGPRREA